MSVSAPMLHKRACTQPTTQQNDARVIVLVCDLTRVAATSRTPAKKKKKTRNHDARWYAAYARVRVLGGTLTLARQRCLLDLERRCSAAARQARRGKTATSPTTQNLRATRTRLQADDPAVRRDLVAHFHEHNVTGNDVLGVNLVALAVADHSGLGTTNAW
jgi:hypothetical protein